MSNGTRTDNTDGLYIIGHARAKTHCMHRLCNERPAKMIKCSLQIQLNHHNYLLRGLNNVNAHMNMENVMQDISPFYKSILRRVDDLWQILMQAISNGFSKALIDSPHQGNRLPLLEDA